MHSQTGSPSTTPPPHRPKGHKHVVSTGRLHTRTTSTKGASKLTKHAHDTSLTDIRKALTKHNSSSATNLKKNISHSNLRRNRSSADVTKRAKDEQQKRPVSVHFEIGDQDKEDGWEEASSTASPTLSRSVSRSAASSNPPSAKPSAANSQAQSPVQSHAPPAATTVDGSGQGPSSARTSTEGRIITERLLQRTPSYNTTKMSLATATPTSAGYLPDDMSKSQDSISASTARVGSKEEIVSRFVGGSGTPSDGSPFLRTRRTMAQESSDDVKRVQSLGNINHVPATTTTTTTRDDDDGDESALLRRSRHSQSRAYIPPQQSRTQQKLWLQRASSNIEPQQMGPGAMNGLAGLHGHGTLGGVPSLPSLVDADDDGRDPRTRIQLERTGLEYLVVRRHQDPVGAALKRLEKAPGMDRFRNIPAQQKKGSVDGGAVGKYGLSQSLRDGRVRTKDKAGGADGSRSSYDAQHQQGQQSSDGGRVEDGVTTLLRSIWEKSFDLSASAE
jgi:hypothetical protein